MLSTPQLSYIAVIRHLQSAANIQPELMAQMADSDIPLSETGVGQAKITAQELEKLVKQVPYNITQLNFLVSPYKRTQQTAENIIAHLTDNKKTIQQTIHPNIREKGLGIYEGLSVDEICARYGDEGYHFITQYRDRTNPTRYTMRPPALIKDVNSTYDHFGDSLADCYTRAGIFLEQELKPQLQNNPATFFVVVGHGMMNPFIQQHMLDCSEADRLAGNPDDLLIKQNGAIQLYQYNGQMFESLGMPFVGFENDKESFLLNKLAPKP